MSDVQVIDQGGPAESRWRAEADGFAASGWSPEAAKVNLKRMISFEREARLTGRWPK